jgi:hypothetical protein
MEYEHLSAMVPGPGQYYPRKHYPHKKMKGVEEKARKYGYFTKGAGKPKPAKKVKPLPKDQWKHPEQVRFKTFRKIEMIHKKKGGKDGIQHWGFSRRFRYDPRPGRAGEKWKPPVPKKLKGKNKPKTAKPGPGRYEITSTWNLDKSNKN